MEWYRKYAKYHNYQINDEIEKTMAEFLAYEKSKNGQYYCPQKPRKPENICPCDELTKEHKCACNFLIRKGDCIE